VNGIDGNSFSEHGFDGQSVRKNVFRTENQNLQVFRGDNLPSSNQDEYSISFNSQERAVLFGFAKRPVTTIGFVLRVGQRHKPREVIVLGGFCQYQHADKLSLTEPRGSQT
jgi:hypothetical protein